MKIDEKSRQKDVTVLKTVLDPSWERFWSILASNLAPKRGAQKSLFDVFWAPGATLGPRWPPDPSKRAPRTDFRPFCSVKK